MAKAKQTRDDGLVAKIRQQPMKYALPVLGLLVVFQGYMWMSEQEPPPPKLTGGDLYFQRISMVQQACEEFKAAHGRLPKGGRDIHKQLGKNRKFVPLVQTKEVELLPDAIVYLVDDGKYAIKAVDSNGTLFAVQDKPLVVTGP